MKRNSFFLISIIILIIGLVFISVSSISEASTIAGDKFYFIKKQLIWFVIGLVSFFAAAKISLGLIKKYSSLFFFSSIILLAAILIPSLSNQTLGARRWLDLGFIGIQPSEILKLSSVIFFAKIFSLDSQRNIKNLIIYLGLPLLLVILEPNLSTAILIAAIVITIYYLSGGEIFSLFALCFAAVAISLILVISSPYRMARFNTLVNLENTNSQTSSYHSGQMILALTSGFWTGKGFANSEQKYRFLPKVSTDSILAVIGEETGFIGCAMVIYLYIYLIINIIKISQSTIDPFSSLVVAGIACWIGYQSLINTAAVVALIPLTGVPLPLISYGGSSLITLMFALGLVQNTQNQNTNLLYSSNSENHKNRHHHRQSSYSRNRTSLPSSFRPKI